MAAVMAAETALGNLPKDVSAEKRGYDIESRDPRSGILRFIEVKGRHADGREVIITKNELLASLNAPDAFFLALVRVDNGFAHEPVYVQHSSSANWGLRKPPWCSTLRSCWRGLAHRQREAIHERIALTSSLNHR